MPGFADLLGFDGIVENSLDANQISPIDTGVELHQCRECGGAHGEHFLISDLWRRSIAMTTPWLTLEEGELTGTSSIMPQKRNPNALHNVALRLARFSGSARPILFKAHNVPHGLQRL